MNTYRKVAGGAGDRARELSNPVVRLSSPKKAVAITAFFRHKKVGRQKGVLRAKVMDIRSFRALKKSTSLLAHKKVMTFSSDELILALVSLVRATRPGMLRQEADGFSVDFEAIARSEAPGDADRLLLKMGSVMGAETPYPAKNPNSSVSVDLDAGEARQIADALAKLETVQAWPQDVMDMSRALRARLTSDAAGGDEEAT